jgi:hypothetical protein
MLLNISNLTIIRINIYIKTVHFKKITYSMLKIVIYLLLKQLL